VSARILEALPDAAIVGVDNSPPMIARAAARLAGYGDRFRQIVADLQRFDPSVLGAARHDVVLILQVLHEIPRAAKIALLAGLRDRIAAGGMVLYGERLRANYDRFALPHAALWDELCRWTPAVAQPGFAARVETLKAKEDFTTDLAGELAAFAEAGYDAEPLAVLGERCLLAAKPRGDTAR
jgi:trans-aconitate methyltransferase